MSLGSVHGVVVIPRNDTTKSLSSSNGVLSGNLTKIEGSTFSS